MSFDFSNLHIESGSPEGQVIQAIVEREHVAPEEALRRALRQVGQPNAAQRMIGLFSSPEDAELIDETMALVRESRQTQTSREIGL